MSIFSVTARGSKALIPCLPPPQMGRVEGDRVPLAGPQDRRQGSDFILGSSSINAIQEVLRLSVLPFPGSLVHGGARRLGFAVSQALVPLQVQHLTMYLFLSSCHSF